MLPGARDTAYILTYPSMNLIVDHNLEIWVPWVENDRFVAGTHRVSGREATNREFSTIGARISPSHTVCVLEGKNWQFAPLPSVLRVHVIRRRKRIMIRVGPTNHVMTWMIQNPYVRYHQYYVRSVSTFRQSDYQISITACCHFLKKCFSPSDHDCLVISKILCTVLCIKIRNRVYSETYNLHRCFRYALRCAAVAWSGHVSQS